MQWSYLFIVMIAYIRSTTSNPDFKHMVSLLDQELWERYPDIEHQYAPFNNLSTEARAILVYEDAGPIGCGCLRPMQETGVVEIKRMYVEPAHRNQGIGKVILTHLEQWALEEGFVQAKLETAKRQPEAIAAYEKSGYTPIPNYGPYVNLPESICMTKVLRHD